MGFVELLCLHAPSAFLASAAGSYDLINQILPARFSGVPCTAVDDAVIQWRKGHNYPPPVSPSSSRQKACMGPPSRVRDAPIGCL